MTELIRNNRIMTIIVNAVLLLIYTVLTIISVCDRNTITSQQEAERFRTGDKAYSQVSAFISQDQVVGLEELNNVRNSLMQMLVEDSYYDTNGNGRVWADTYSSEKSVEISNDRSSLNVTAVGIGGDFFLFHPMRLLAGGYISESDLNHDRIVVDKNFAWNMFGSFDIVGMHVWIGNNIYYVSGVVDVDDDNVSEIAYGQSDRIYMYWDKLKELQDDLYITCYEAVLPEPITNYAFYALQSAFGLYEEMENADGIKDMLCFDNVEVIENTNRYNRLHLLRNFKLWKYNNMRVNNISYPFWENIARVKEMEQTIYLFLRLIVLFFLSIRILFVIKRLCKYMQDMLMRKFLSQDDFKSRKQE